MVPFDVMKSISTKTESKILFLILDGLGGLQNPTTGKSELESANIPNINKLASESVCGLSVPVSHGITPGSGPGHLSLFGYDPFKYNVGRGVLEALGVNFPLQPGDVAFRINMATVDENGIITDRRAGRIPTEKSKKICEELDEKIEIPGIETFVMAVKEHRGALVFRGKNLAGNIADTDPQKEGLKPKPAIALDEESKYTAELANKFIEKAAEIMKDKSPANFIMLRGASGYHGFPQMQDIYKLTPAAIATYPMYKGIVRLLGMDVVDTGDTFEGEIKALHKYYDKYDFFYFHIKKTDAKGEDGNFEGKIEALEEVDKKLPEILELNFDVVVLTGDHSTPAMMKSHSWHPLPVLIKGKFCRPDSVEHFNEKECAKGGLGVIQAVDIMPLALANAGKLLKYGA
ncbi:MAG: 2,3-bisphosphoglycerate-independent phosphoglycerate mutase [Candidatus Schekmanbacteria bacterium]|nr:MAG: 2,3-bisphosphoglycerate-independent phosphoglycerate mutase [Candidatus Schekmanbacteria bacterium]